jgi:flagellar motor switch protein FliG
LERKTFTQAEKAAVILLALGEEDAAEILRALPPEDMRRILSAAARLGRIDELTADQVMNEFAATLGTLKQGIEGSPRSAAKFLNQFARQRGVEVAVGDIIDFATPALRETLARTDMKALTTAMKKEHPQVIAIVAVHLEPKLMGQLLKSLASPLQGDVIQRIARLEAVDPDLINDIEESIRTSLTGPAFSQKQLGGVEKIAATLNAMAPDDQITFLDNLERQDPVLAAAVRDSMFTFADLLRIDTRSLQRLLRDIPAPELAAALRGADQTLKDHLYAGLSTRSAAQLEADITEGKKLPLTVVQSARTAVAAVARKLLASGEIELTDSLVSTKRTA